ncbi:hypothetical protein K449DRAFT_431658 [Hypoxylon sp. EC38]|nr:hypothetical protein K449DRAFT_431658 [Hypoxylon sp. EC38]
MSDCLEYFDFDAFSDANEYTLDFNNLDNAASIGQHEHNPASDIGFSGPLGATATPVEPPMNVEAETGPSKAQSYYSTAAPETHNVSQDQNIQLGSDAILKPDQHKLNVSHHSPVQGASKNTCLECKVPFKTQWSLEDHVREQGHSTFLCSCDEVFARYDALIRHVKSFRKETPKFPCTFCKRHRGKHGFRRGDHLVQHLSGYHKLDEEEIRKVYPTKNNTYNHFNCPRPGCEFHGGEGFYNLEWSERRKQAPFKKRSTYHKHLKDVHKVTPFNCPVPGCERVDAKGYMADNGLKKHLAREHSNAPQHLTKLLEELEIWWHKCDHCGKQIHRLAEFNVHRQLAHQL